MDITPPQHVAEIIRAEPTTIRAESTTTRAARYLWALTRLCLGWTFLWPFLDKTFGLGHETIAAHAWIHGGSSSFGFLSGAAGPFAGLYQSIAGAGWVNWLFMLGIGMRIAAVAGAVLLVLLVLMWAPLLLARLRRHTRSGCTCF